MRDSKQPLTLTRFVHHSLCDIDNHLQIAISFKRITASIVAVKSFNHANRKMKQVVGRWQMIRHRFTIPGPESSLRCIFESNVAIIECIKGNPGYINITARHLRNPYVTAQLALLFAPISCKVKLFSCEHSSILVWSWRGLCECCSSTTKNKAH